MAEQVLAVMAVLERQVTMLIVLQVFIMLAVGVAVHMLAELWAQAAQEEAAMADLTHLAQLQQAAQTNWVVVVVVVVQMLVLAAMVVMA